MKYIFPLFLFLINIISLGQTKISTLSELQKIYFISETNSLTSNFVNPAALSINKNDDGFLLGYDFLEPKTQGNNLVSLSMGNLGFVYQDIYNLPNMQLTSYALNISVGGDFLSIGTSNKFINVKSSESEKTHFTIDAGLILQPFSYLSIGFLANNINKVEIENLENINSFTIGARITFIKSILNVFVQTDFNERKELNTNVKASAGFSLIPINFLELRTFLMGTRNIIDEGILSAIFSIENGFIISTSAHFNDNKERTRYNVMFALPLKTISF